LPDRSQQGRRSTKTLAGARTAMLPNRLLEARPLTRQKGATTAT